jgi:hypothetical protein
MAEATINTENLDLLNSMAEADEDCSAVLDELSMLGASNIDFRDGSGQSLVNSEGRISLFWRDKY